MKKTYKKPETCCFVVNAQPMMAGSLGSNSTPNAIINEAEESSGGRTADSRRRFSIWDDEE